METIGAHTSIHDYSRYFDKALPHIRASPSRAITLDGGPHTFWWPLQQPDGSAAPPELLPPPQIIRAITPHAKFLVTLSNPVNRMYSDYHFLNDDLHLADKSVHKTKTKSKSRGGGLRGGKGGGGENSIELPDPLSEKSPEIFHERAVQQVRDFRQCVAGHMNSSQHLDTLSDSSGATASAMAAFSGAKGGEEVRELAGMSKELKQVVLGRWFRAAQICAHDRHAFGVAGWGRLSVGLYSLFYEKWLEHFAPSQFKVLRLEDYDTEPREYLKDIFAFLEVDMPVDDEEWAAIIGPAVKNKHRTARLPMLPETKALLEQFYRPYNILLARALKDRRFLWGDASPVQHDAHSPDALTARAAGEGEGGHEVHAEKVSQKKIQLNRHG
jgi:hypothetical protein